MRIQKIGAILLMLALLGSLLVGCTPDKGESNQQATGQTELAPVMPSGDNWIESENEQANTQSTPVDTQALQTEPGDETPETTYPQATQTEPGNASPETTYPPMENDEEIEDDVSFEIGENSGIGGN